VEAISSSSGESVYSVSSMDTRLCLLLDAELTLLNAGRAGFLDVCVCV
jgi:hypothetical protein